LSWDFTWDKIAAQDSNSIFVPGSVPGWKRSSLARARNAASAESACGLTYTRPAISVELWSLSFLKTLSVANLSRDDREGDQADRTPTLTYVADGSACGIRFAAI
jgi:hypothetical protein